MAEDNNTIDTSVIITQDVGGKYSSWVISSGGVRNDNIIHVTNDPASIKNAAAQINGI